MTETECSAEYLILRYLNNRNQCYYITDQCLRAQLFDVDESEYKRVFNSLLNEHKYIEYKKDYEKGLTINSQGANRLGIMEGKIAREKATSKERHWKERYSLLIDFSKILLGSVLGVIGYMITHSEPESTQNQTPKETIQTLTDTLVVHKTDTVYLNDSTFKR